MQNHTHTEITIIIDTSEQGYNAAISSWRDMQNHTHRSCSQVIDLVARGHWTSSIFVNGLENLFLACNETTKLPWLTCIFGLQEHSASGRGKHRKNNDHWTQDEGLFILKTMIIGHSCAKGVRHKNSSRSCVRGMSNPITHITRIFLATERSRRRKKREK
jgi:hypothetical protein